MISSIIVIIAKHKHHRYHYQHFYLVQETYFAVYNLSFMSPSPKKGKCWRSWYRQVAHCWAEEKNIKGKFCNVCRWEWLSIVFNIILGSSSFPSQPSHIIIISLIIGIVQIEKYSLPPSSAIITTIVIIVVSSSNNSIIIVNNFHQISTFSGKSSKKYPAFVVKVRHEVAVAMEEQIYPRHLSILVQKAKSHQIQSRVDVSMKSIAWDRGAFQTQWPKIQKLVW